MRFISDKYGYRAIFDEITGKMVRFEKNRGDYLWKKSGPELLDISITNYCERGCDFCYRNSGINGKNMSLDLYKRIIAEAKQIGVLQIALGGGNPNQHPDFMDFLRIARENKIVPSYTTNGQGMSDKIINATKRYAGAVAVSWYEPNDNAISLIEKCHDMGILINIHFVLDGDNICEARSLLEKEILDKVNALIFLKYKPVGNKKRNILRKSDELTRFLNTLIDFRHCKIGFDSCMISNLALCENRINPCSVDYCEAARYSAFISEEGMMYPCSFMCGGQSKGNSILEESIIDIWTESTEFREMRSKLFSQDRKCVDCEKYNFCHGGCPFFSINCVD